MTRCVAAKFDTATAKRRTLPLKTGVIQVSAPSSCSPVIPTATRKIAITVPQTLKKPGRIAVAPRKAAAYAGRR